MLVRRTCTGADPVAMDSGATCHMLNNQNLFPSMKKSYPRTVTIGDGSKLSSNKCGTGFITFSVDGGGNRSLQLDNVLYVPALETNLISYSALDKKGYSLRFESEKCTVMRNGERICTAYIEGGLYVVRSTHVDAIAHVSQSPTESEEMWHRRFGHVYLRTIKAMERDGTVSGLSFK